MSSNYLGVSAPFKRLDQTLKILGGGNAAGVVALTSAFNTFSNKPALLTNIKIAIVLFAVGVISFSIAYAVVTMFRFMTEDDDEKSLPPHPATYRPHSSVPGFFLWVLALTSYLSVATFFGGLLVSFVALLRL